MHFIPEACHKRPLEPKALAYSRGATAITMGILFLSFCGYLINLMYHETPLIQISSEKIVNHVDTPDIEFCVQNSTMQMLHCSAMLHDWTTVPIENCWQRFFRHGPPSKDVSKCFIFETNGTYKMTTGYSNDNKGALLRLDFYWKIDNLYNVTAASASTPSIAVQLYDSRFSPWKASTVGSTPVETLIYANIKLGATRATTFLNHTSTIFYSPQKYRAIKPNDAAALIGFTPNYIDINTLPNFEQTWPLLDDPPGLSINRSLFNGLLSVQLSQSTIDVKTEVRQHTLLASLALAGGCYGVLTTLYIIFFGMNRLTPWGLVHHVPVLIRKRKYKKEKYKDDLYLQNQSVPESSSFSSIPWFFNSRQKKTKKVDADQSGQQNKSPVDENFSENVQLQHSSINVFEPLFEDKSTVSPQIPMLENPFILSPVDSGTVGSRSLDSHTDNFQNVHNMLLKEHTRNNELNTRVEELETILAEYFIDTSYVDKLRGRRKSLESDINHFPSNGRNPQ